MQRRNRSILENAVMAEALVRLSYLAHRPDFYDEAVQALEAFANDYKEYGYYVAGYGRAVDLILYEPLTVTITSECAHCARSVRFELDHELRYRVTEGAEPLIFAPFVDFEKLEDPSIIDAF